MTVKIIEFPGQRRGSPKIATCEDAFMHSVLDLAVELADGSSPHLLSVSIQADQSLAELHRAITQLLGWDESHNYFFSQGCYRYEDPLLFGAQDQLLARCRRVYCAADVPAGLAFGQSSAPLYYLHNLTSSRELKITLSNAVAMKQFG